MKRVVIGTFLLLGVFALVIGSYFYINGSTIEIIGKAELVQKSFSEGDYEKASLFAEETASLWNDFNSSRLLWADNEYIVEISKLISKVITLTKMKSEDTMVECGVLLTILKDFHDTQAPGYKNIF